MSELLIPSKNYECDGIDPDPATLILTWLGAVGSIASIVSWAEQNQEARREQWEREVDESARYKCLQKVTDIESDMAVLEAQIGKIDILLRIAQGSTANGEPMMVPQTLRQAPFAFGGVRLNLPNELMKEFVRFHKETATVCKRVGTNVIALIQELSGNRIFVNPEVAHRLFEFREHLNRILRSESYLAAVEGCKETIRIGRYSMTVLKDSLFHG